MLKILKLGVSMRNIAKVAGKAISGKRFVIGLVSLFVAVVAPLIAASPANAANAASYCYGGNVCLYQHKDFGGSSVEVYILGETCYNLGFLNNQVSSVKNYTGYEITYYDVAGCNGCYFEDGIYSERQNLATDGWWNCLGSANDKISSFRIH